MIVNKESRIYVSSRANEPMKLIWKQFRDCGADIVSSWIDVSSLDGNLTPTQFMMLWETIEAEIALCDALVAYIPAEESVRRVFVEIGMALALKKNVHVVVDGGIDPETFRPAGSWVHSPSVVLYPTITDAMNYARHYNIIHKRERS